MTGDFEVHPVGTGERMKRLEALLREARNHSTVNPCDCGMPECLTARIDQALAA